MYDWITASYVYSKESGNPNDFVPRQRYVQQIIQTNEVKNFHTNTEALTYLSMDTLNKKKDLE